MTVGKAGFGLFGGLAAQADGNAIVRENGIPDPALQIQARLTALLSDRLQPSTTNSITGRPTKLDDVASLSRDAGSDQVILDVETNGWIFMYMAFSPSHYRIIYTGDARLIDASTAKRVGRASCTYKSDDKEPPTYDEMLAEKAARLKTMFAAAADHCADEMARDLHLQ